MTTDRIPTEAELASELGGIERELGSFERLLTAKKWKRAAIVWAFTTNDGPGNPHTPPEEDSGNAPKKEHYRVPMRKFAERKYAGLSKFDTVAYYRKAWQDAIDQGKAREMHPGDKFEAPDLPWPPSPRTQDRDNQEHAEELKAAAAEAGISSTTVLDIASNKEALKAAIKGSSAVRETAHAALDEEAAARYTAKPGSERLVKLAKDTGVPLADVVHLAENPKAREVVETVIRSDSKLRQAASDAIGKSVQDEYPDLKFRPEDPDDIQFGALFEARTELDRAVRAAQNARRKLRDVAMDAANKGVIAGLVHRLVEVTEDLRRYVDDDVFETGIRRVLEEGEAK
jgi:hypothetical protein